jgi:hypothetical protein
MASDTVQTDYDKEKQQVSHHIEDATTSPTTHSMLELQKEVTLKGVDMNNTHALKGDDSDGKVEWSIRSIFAAIFLAALYTGIPPFPFPSLLSHTTPAHPTRNPH